MAPWQDAPVTSPAPYVTADRDLMFTMPGMADPVAGLRAFVPNQTDTVFLPGCGHWTEPERPAEVDAALPRFLGTMNGGAGRRRWTDRGRRAAHGICRRNRPARSVRVARPVAQAPTT